MTRRQRGILRHSLFGSSGARKPYRNRYCSQEGCDTWACVQSLVALGFMVQCTKFGDGKLEGFCVTDAGMRAVGVDPETVDPEDRVP